MPYTFAQDGEYEIQVCSRAIWRDVSGLRETAPARDAGAGRPGAGRHLHGPEAADGAETLIDKDLKARVALKAGPHDLAVTFVKEGSSLIDTARQPTNPASTTGGIRGRRPRSTRFR